jgi:hypothetical protein
MALSHGSQMGLPGIDDDQISPPFQRPHQSMGNDPFFIALREKNRLPAIRTFSRKGVKPFLSIGFQ